MAVYKFNDVFEDATRKGKKIPTNQYLLEGKYPIIDQGKEDIGGYTNTKDGLFTNVPAIIFGDHTRIIKYVDRPFFIGADGVKILEKKVVEADYKYLFYALNHAYIPDTGYNRHFKFLKEISITIPSIVEQRNIVQQLDLLSSMIDKQLSVLEIYDNLVKSRFIEMFGDLVTNPMGWEVSSLDKHLDVVGGYAFKSSEFVQEGIPVLRIGNINSGKFQETNMVYFKKDDTLSRYEIYPGDLVISLTGTVGKSDYGNVCIMGKDYPLYYLNQRNAKLALYPTLSPQYLAEVMKDDAIKGKLTGISRGIRQANISNKDILNLEIPIPPIDVQNRFADFVTLIEKSKLAVQKNIETLQNLKSKLMQDYFG